MFESGGGGLNHTPFPMKIPPPSPRSVHGIDILVLLCCTSTTVVIMKEGYHEFNIYISNTSTDVTAHLSSWIKKSQLA